MTITNIKKIEQAKELLSEVLDIEQEIFDSKSEKWQDSEIGEAVQEIIDSISSAIDSLDLI